MDKDFIIRKASPADAEAIHWMLNHYAGERLVLPRSLENVRENIDEFSVAQSDGKVAGCCTVRDFGNKLYEIRSLAVSPDFVNRGIGTTLIHKAVEELKKNGTCTIFALTYRSGLFIKAGFKLTNKERFPQKIWSDCYVCDKREHCDEDAVILEI